MTTLSKRGARNVSTDLDRLAGLFEENASVLGVPPRIAVDFALRCDLLSDHLERVSVASAKEAAGEADMASVTVTVDADEASDTEPAVQVVDDEPKSDDQNKPNTYYGIGEDKGSKQAGDEDDLLRTMLAEEGMLDREAARPGPKNETGESVEPGPAAQPHWDANAIADDVGGPEESESDEPYMKGEFTQQEFHELRDKQQSGDLNNGVPDGKTASTEAVEMERLAAELHHFKESGVPVIPGFPGMTPHIRTLSGLRDQLDLLAKRIEAEAGELLRQKKGLDKEYTAAVEAFRKDVPAELELQGRLIMVRKTALIEVEAQMQVKRNPRTPQQVQNELLARVTEAYSQEVADFIVTTEKTLRQQDKKMSIVFEGFKLEERTKAASAKEAGMLDMLVRFRDWMVGKSSTLLRYFKTATSVIKGADADVEAVAKQWEKAFKEAQRPVTASDSKVATKAPSSDNAYGYNLSE